MNHSPNWRESVRAIHTRPTGATISTFGGNPIATTAAKAVIDFIEDQKLGINAAEVGALAAGTENCLRTCLAENLTGLGTG